MEKTERSRKDLMAQMPYINLIPDCFKIKLSKTVVREETIKDGDLISFELGEDNLIGFSILKQDNATTEQRFTLPKIWKNTAKIDFDIFERLSNYRVLNPEGFGYRVHLSKINNTYYITNLNL